jgi:hypothetical protein
VSRSRPIAVAAKRTWTATLCSRRQGHSAFYSFTVLYSGGVPSLSPARTCASLNARRPHPAFQQLFFEISSECADYTPGVKVVVGVPRRKATVRRCTCCIRDEGRPLGVADQAVIPNHPELHSLRAGVVSVCGKGGMNPVRCAVRRRTKVNHRRSVDNCNDVKTEDSTTPRDQSNGNLKVGLTASGIEVARPFCRRGYGTWEPVVSMSREKLKRRTRESESTDARHRGGVMRSSVEGVVMTSGAKA